MPIRIGNIEPKDIRIGNTPIQKVYDGNKLVWNRSIPLTITSSRSFGRGHLREWIFKFSFGSGQQVSGFTESDIEITQSTGHQPVRFTRSNGSVGSFVRWVPAENLYRYDIQLRREGTATVTVNADAVSPPNEQASITFSL